VATELMKALIQTGQVTTYLNTQKEYYSDLVMELADMLIEKSEKRPNNNHPETSVL
jgi:hypothetical protein